MGRQTPRLNSTPRLGTIRPASAGWVLAVAVLGLGKAFATTPCAGLVTLSIPNTAITSAAIVPATGSTPAYCNVLATVGGGAGSQRTLVVDPEAIDLAIASLPSVTDSTASGGDRSDGLQTLYVNPETGM